MHSPSHTARRQCASNTLSECMFVDRRPLPSPSAYAAVAELALHLHTTNLDRLTIPLSLSRMYPPHIHTHQNNTHTHTHTYELMRCSAGGLGYSPAEVTVRSHLRGRCNLTSRTLPPPTTRGPPRASYRSYAHPSQSNTETNVVESTPRQLFESLISATLQAETCQCLVAKPGQ